MTTRTLKDHTYASARILFCDDGSVALQSYNTIVCTLDADGWLTVGGLYSRTTIKHIGWFMREYGSTYQVAKMAYEYGMRVNIHTGELIN